MLQCKLLLWLHWLPVKRSRLQGSYHNIIIDFTQYTNVQGCGESKIKIKTSLSEDARATMGGGRGVGGGGTKRDKSHLYWIELSIVMEDLGAPGWSNKNCEIPNKSSP